MDSVGMDTVGGWFHDGVIHQASEPVGRECHGMTERDIRVGVLELSLID